MSATVGQSREKSTVIPVKLPVNALPAVSPFRVLRLPAICRLYLSARKLQQGRLPARLLGGVLRRIHSAATRLPLPGHAGLFEATIRGKVKQISFNGRNLQFRALYMPAYRKGYEIATSFLLDRLLVNKTTFYDIGSNWGYFSIFVAARPDFEGQVYAFEPNPVAAADIRATVQQAGLEDFITVLQIGVGSAGRTMFIDSQDLVHTGRTQLRSSQERGMQVDVSRLDDLALPPPDVIKVDGQGMELDILKGGEAKIRKNRPVIVFENWCNTRSSLSSDYGLVSAEGVLTYLRGLHYELFVPAIFFRDDKMEVLCHNDEICADLMFSAMSSQLRLVSMQPNMRPILIPELNLVACHADEISRLAQRLGREVII